MIVKVLDLRAKLRDLRLGDDGATAQRGDVAPLAETLREEALHPTRAKKDEKIPNPKPLEGHKRGE